MHLYKFMKRKIKNRIKKILKYFFIAVLIIFCVFFISFFVGFGKEKENIAWGVNFSQKHSSALGINWQENYLALLDDLGAKKIKLTVHWDLIEPAKDAYNFTDLDWQINEAEKRDANILLVMGMKTPRWPECHIPKWAEAADKKAQQKYILDMLQTIVLRYKNNKSIWAWQVENEVFFKFGECPWQDKKFLKEEVALVKSLDSERPIVITDSGEYSFWINAAKIGDIVGITTYRKVWFKELRSYFPYPLPAIFYMRRANLIKKLFNKEVICVELQAEPWGPKLIYDLPLDVQAKSMDLEHFKKNISFAKKTNLKEFYLWGAEWWYWMKEKHNQPEIWNEAKKLFSS